MPHQSNPAGTPVTLFGCNASDGALAYGFKETLDTNHPATIPPSNYEAIETAQKGLEANPDWDTVVVTSEMDCPSLADALSRSADWRTGNEQYLVHRFGIFLRLFHEDDRHAEIEFEISLPDGLSIPAPNSH